jgi:hypothetical protein
LELINAEQSFVEFCGANSGTFDLSWGQEQMCEWMRNSAPHIEHMNLGVLVECTRPTTLGGLRDAVKALVERHEALRTRISLHEDGSYRQVVYATGAIPVRTYRSITWDQSLSVLRELKSSPFTVFEWPLRIAVITADDAVAGVVLCLFHVMTDGWGCDVLSRDLNELLRATPDQRRAMVENSRRPLIQPREHAAAQRGTDRGKSDLRAERFWASQFARFPNDRFPVPLRDPETPRFPKITMESAAAGRALSEAASRYSTTAAVVLISALSVLLSAVSGLEAVTFRLFSANRPSESSRNSIGSFAQEVPVAVEVGDLPFREIMRGVWHASLGAYRVGERDPRRIAKLTDSVITTRGVDPDLECFVNIHSDNGLSGNSRGAGSPPRTALCPTEFYETTGIDEWEEGKFFVNAWPTPGHLRVMFWVDTALFSRDEIVGFLRCLETILLRVATDRDLRAGELICGAEQVAALRRVDGLVQMDGCWVSLEDVRRLLAEVWPSPASQVFLRRDSARTTLTAYLAEGEGGHDPRDVHRAMLEGVRARRFVMTPHHYVICRSAPSNINSEREWQLQSVIVEGPGR